MTQTDTINESLITAKTLPAILIGGPPKAGKSVLTYNLTRELRRRQIPHYVFRASADIEGDWFLEGDLDTVDQIVTKVKEYRHWTDIFRAFVCRDLADRHLPLIVDLGGLPRDADTCIFQVCTHSILLLKPEDEEATQTWYRFTTASGLTPIADLRSQLEGKSFFTAKESVIKGTITGLHARARLHDDVFDAVLERVIQLFSSFDANELENIHLNDRRLGNMVGNVVHLPQLLKTYAPDAVEGDDAWEPEEMLPQLLTDVAAQQALAVYGRAPNWVYGALALHGGTQPFQQFDARLGWVMLPTLGTRSPEQSLRPLMYISEENRNDAYIILIHPIHNYLDYREADQLVFPEPPSNRGVIVTGKLPLWLFTALARFYVQRNVPWIALNDARYDMPVVVYSQTASHPIGRILPKL